MPVTDAQLRSSQIVVASHHPRTHCTSPCTSIHALFLADGAPYPAARHVHLGGDTPATGVLKGLSRPLVLFNSFAALTRRDSASLMAEALAASAQVVVYWHETAWNLREFLTRDREGWSLIRPALSGPDVVHWVPTFQNAQFVAFLLGVPFEQIQVVFETVDVAAIRAAAGPRPPHGVGAGSAAIAPPIPRFAGAGVGAARKGLDIFGWLSTRLPGRFDWYAPRASQTPDDIAIPGHRVQFMGHRAAFAAALQGYDAFLMTSRDDPSPIVCLEAMALGLPVFAFGTTGYVEVLPAPFLARDPEDMRRKVEAWMTDRDRGDTGVFTRIAAAHDVSAFAAKLETAALVPGLEAALPAVDDGDPFGAGMALAAAMAASKRRHDEAAASFASWRDTHRSELRAVTAARQEADALVAQRRRSDEASMQDKLARLEDANQALLDAHRTARIELKSRMRAAWSDAGKPTPRRVAVVGNAPSVLDNPQGAFIDAADLVIRINNFRTDSFEAAVGSRTDCVVLTPACRPNPTLAQVAPSNRLLHAANFAGDTRRMTERMLRPDGVGIPPSDMQVLPATLYYLGLRLLMKLPAGQWASTGSVALQWAIDMFAATSEIWVHGIDFFGGTQPVQSGGQIAHYFDHVTRADGHHDGLAEARYFQPRFAAGDLRLL